MITVMKASAGSGKTYALAQKYLRLLRASNDPLEYRHILAVTFTNKATGEMKDRIIRELAKSENECDKKYLLSILHDYGSFAVSTIDRFFQQTLRAFARELGQFNSYQVELDKEALVDEAVDTILDELNADDRSDRQMIEFIVTHMVDRLTEGIKLDVETDLKEMARQLKSESFSRKCAELGMDKDVVYSPSELSGLRKTCRNIIEDFEKEVRSRTGDVVKAMETAGYSYADFKRNWMQFLDKFKDWHYKNPETPSDAVLSKLNDPSAENWFKKADVGRFDSAYSALGDVLERFGALWSEDGMKTFKTALLLNDQVYGLGVAARLFAMFDRISRQKNVVCLDESNSLLRDIIDGSDAPFVYEKTGVRFNTFLLDEFQDTSATQWNNFKPLLEESESRKAPVTTPADATPQQKDDLHRHDNLIVGDVKQSIYRWRESDWSLLDSKVEQDFQGRTYFNPLECNWRSLDNIVNFNNALYPYLASAIDSLNKVPSGMNSVSKIYEGCHQNLGRQEQRGGCVDVRFTEDDEMQLNIITETIRDAVENHGAKYGDIAVLVRTKATGTTVAQKLIDEQIPVVTDASLKIKNSISVRRLVSMMSYVDNPQNEVGTYIAQKYNIATLPSSYHSLPDLAELMYKTLCSDSQCREDCRKEIMYVTSFMDSVLEYSNANGSNLHEFLAWWEKDKSNVNAAESDSAVKIVTIHKSKGLSYPYVIVPFIEKIKLFDDQQTFVWAQPQKRNDPLDPFCDRLYYVKLNSGIEGTAFSQCLEMEKFNQGVDVINMLYVATTRAEKALLITANKEARSFDKSIASLLFGFCTKDNAAQESGDFHSGEMPSFDIEESPDESATGSGNQVKEMPLAYPYYNIARRLVVRPYASDFFTDEDDSYEHLSFRERGIVLHDILSRVAKPSDLSIAIDKSIADGSLAADSREKVLAFLGRRISAHPEFFPAEDNVKLFRETTLIASDGREYRPDRVMVRPDGSVMIVDYKFASPRPEYNEQIARYEELYRAMGYDNVRAALWYVYKDKIIFND